MTRRSPGVQPPQAAVSRRNVISSLTLLPLVSTVGCSSEDTTAGIADPPAAPPENPYVAAFDAFLKAFNDRDIERALSFFSDSATWKVNELVLDGHEAIRAVLVEYGASEEGAAIDSAWMAKELVHPAEGAVLVEGRVTGKVLSSLSGFPPNGLKVPIAFAMFCWFDEDGRCASCESFMNWGSLLAVPI
jgi:hypothetical protein